MERRDVIWPERPLIGVPGVASSDDAAGWGEPGMMSFCAMHV